MTVTPALTARVRRFFATDRAKVRPVRLEVDGRPLTLWEVVAPAERDRNGPLRRMGVGADPLEAWHDALTTCA